LRLKRRESISSDQTIFYVLEETHSAVARTRDSELKIGWTKEANRKECGRRKGGKGTKRIRERKK
jgi:hypothetical protein